MTSDSVYLQIDRCFSVLKLFTQCMNERKWNKIPDRLGRINVEMEALRVSLIDYSSMDEDMTAQVKYLEIKFRRTQRKVALHMSSMSADIETLEGGISQAKAAKTLLEGS